MSEIVWLGIKVLVILFLLSTVSFTIVEENPESIEGETVLMLNDFPV